MIKGKVGFRFTDREETYEAGDAYYVPPGHTPVHYTGRDRRVQPHGHPRRDDPGGDEEPPGSRGRRGKPVLNHPSPASAKDVRSALHSCFGTPLEIVAGAEDDILDPSSVGLVGQGDPLGGPAA